MNVLLNKQRHRRNGSVEKFRNFRKFPRRGVSCFPSLECSCISRARLSVVKIRDYSQSNKELAYLTREGYLQQELLSEYIVPGYLNVDIKFLLFSLPLCCCWFLLSRLVLKRLRWKSCTCVCLLSLIKLWFSN